MTSKHYKTARSLSTPTDKWYIPEEDFKSVRLLRLNCADVLISCSFYTNS